MAKRLILLALCLALILSGCASGKQETNDPASEPNDIISDAVTPEKEPITTNFGLAYQAQFGLNPYQCTSLTNRTILSLLYESLFTVTSGFQVEPVLCEYYDVSSDLKRCTVHLVPEAQFWDGTRLTSADVAASYKAAMNSPVYGERFYALDSIETPDSSTVVFNTWIPYENLTLLLDVPIVQADTVDSAVPHGTGPYRLVQERYTNTLVRNGYWWQDTYDAVVSVPGIDLVPTATPTDVRDDFEYGVTSVVCTDPNSAAYVDYHCDYELWNCSTTIMDYVGFNVYHGLFSLTELRVALTYIIDRKAIATELYHGYAEASVLPASPLSSYYDETLAAQYDYNPEKFINAVRATHAKTSEAVFLVCNADPRRVDAAEFIAAEAEKYDIHLIVDAVNERTYLDRLYTGDFDLYLGEARLSPTFDLSPFFDGGSLCYGSIFSNDLTGMCRDAMENSGNYYTLHSSVMANGMLCPVLFKSYAVYATRGVISNMYPAIDNVFYSSNGRTLSDAINAAPEQPVSPDAQTANETETEDASSGEAEEEQSDEYDESEEEESDYDYDEDESEDYDSEEYDYEEEESDDS